MKKISVAIIVKDEEAIIERCLLSVLQFADEVVIVDTGSTDNTKEIVREKFEGDKVKLFESEAFTQDTPPEEFRFGTAKNEAIKKCTGDWITWWDADDFCDEVSAKAIRRIAEESNPNCLWDFRMTFGTMSFLHCRMFPFGRNILFDETHSCHEYLETRGLPRRLAEGVLLQHLPKDHDHGRKSMMRNMKLLEYDYNERGMNDQRTLFYLANTYREAGNHKPAIKMYKEYLKVSHWAEERMFAQCYICDCCKAVGEWKDARKHALSAIMEDDRYAEPYCRLGDLYREAGRMKDASLWYQMAINLGGPPSDSQLFVIPALYDQYPKEWVSNLNTHFSAHEEAAEMKEQIFKGKTEAVPKAEGPEPKPHKTVPKIIVRPMEESKEEALMSGAAMKELERQRDMKVIVNCKSKDVFEGLGFETTDREASVEIEVPKNLGGKSVTEWMCRSLGVVPKGDVEINSSDGNGKKEEGKSESNGSCDYAVCISKAEWAGRQEILCLSLRGAGSTVENLVGMSDESKKKVAEAKTVICDDESWARNAAKGRVVVLAPEEGVEDGHIPLCSGHKLDDLRVRTVVEELKKLEAANAL